MKMAESSFNTIPQVCSKEKISKKNKKVKVINIILLIIVLTGVLLSLLMNQSIMFNNKESIIKQSKKMQESIINTQSIQGQNLDTDVIEMESIVQGFRDIDLPDGEYKVSIEDEIYAIELINYYDDTRYSLEAGQTSKTISLGDSSTTYKMLVVKYHGNLIIDEGVTVTATKVGNYTYKKGMYLCVLGDIENNGTISMTARGTYNCVGQNVYLWKNIDNTYEYVPKVGGAGGAAVSGRTVAGRTGGHGVGRQTGGGASGGAYDATSGAGSAGTSYSGGSGGGGGSTANGQSASPNGGAGGARGGRGDGGGAGNPAAAGGTNGTGGLLIMYSDKLYNNGEISSKGSKGGNGYLYQGNYWEGGGSSGGGSINIFTNQVHEYNSIVATGGTRGGATGGIGGNGTVTINELDSILNYPEKNIKLKPDETYNIDFEKISYTKLNELQIENLTVRKYKI